MKSPTGTEITAPSGQALAQASLATGLLAFFSSLFLVGGLFGVAGLVLGVAHLAQRRSRNGVAWTGIMLSAIGLGASIGFAFVYYPTIKKRIEQARQTQQRNYDEFSRWKGVPAPDFSFTTVAGQKLTLSELKGKRVVLDFWATWCQPCVMELPHFIRLRNEQSTDTLFLVGISDEDVGTLQAFVKKKGINYPIATAADLPAPYNAVTAIPTTFFIDRNGLIQDVAIGYHEFEALQKLALNNDLTDKPKPAPTSPVENGVGEGKKQ